ncbi:MAG TPA: hypothetical protein VJT72_04230, partial [Pseudonocardiaceae bacterium]|nr:hypothetical protein [Pseudonocardiaceae bacterium]
LMRMLHPDPAQRPGAAAVADQLRQLVGALAGPLGSAAAGPPPCPAPLPWVAPSPGTGLSPTVAHSSAGQWKWWWVVAAVVVVLWLAGSLLAVFGPP